MRRYAPASVEAVLDGLLAEPSLARRRRPPRGDPAREARTAPLPDWLDPRLGRRSRRAASSRSTSTRPRRSRPSPPVEDIVVVTPTASGKTLCYALPIAPGARRRPVRPRPLPVPDQGARPGPGRELARARPGRRAGRSRRRPTTGTRRRRSARRSGPPARSSSTNPDMLHSAILPHHTKWFQLFEQLRIIVIDELHTYRGRLRQPRRQRPPAAPPPVRPLRLAPGHRLLLGHDREPGRAGRAADRPAEPARSTATARRPASATSCSSSRRCSTRRPARADRP